MNGNLPDVSLNKTYHIYDAQAILFVESDSSREWVAIEIISSWPISSGTNKEGILW